MRRMRTVQVPGGGAVGSVRPTSRRRAGAVVAALAVAASGLVVVAPPASAASVSKIDVSGSAGNTYQASATAPLFAKQGATVTFKVTTSSDTKCVEVQGAFAAVQTDTTAKTSWTFTTTAPAGDGDRAITVYASPGFNNNNKCTGSTESMQSKYVLDNTGPTLSSALTPAANAAGWNSSNVSGTWTAGDGTGSGVGSGPTPATLSQTANGIQTHTSEATDRVGNKGSGSVTVRLDKAAPTITATETKNADGTTTVRFSCDDSTGGGGDSSGIASCVADGTSPASASRTVAPGTTVTGTATDMAGNTATASVTVAKGDTTAPLLSGAPLGTPNGDGWYRGDVTVRWTASDPESGIPAPPSDTVIVGEGTGLTSTTSVDNGAGLRTTAQSSPAVDIDRTAPTTGISGTSNSWVNGTVQVTLSPSDNLSGVTSTSYSVDGGTPAEGTILSLADEGTHTVSYSSTDRAGNVEAAKTATIKIDRTAPRIGHTFSPLTYTDGAWTNGSVTVTFECTDQGGSGVEGCTAPVTVSTEGEGQQVVGTATDGAGNTASDTATVSIDKTQPDVDATVDRDPNANLAANGKGWYGDDVTVRFSARDALSGIASRSADIVLAEGADQSASGTATDRAGNSRAAGVTGINVDKTMPELTGAAPSGWHRGDVTVTWAASDALSGLAGAVPAPATVTGEGADLSATTSVSDNAGNVRTTTVGGIRIDRTEPTTTASVPELPASGWYQPGVEVALTGSDNLSGATTFYTVDGGAPQTYHAPFTVSTPGTTTVAFWSVDGAGNTEVTGAPLTLSVDGWAPTTTVKLPPPAESGWYLASGLPVAFEVTDGADGSGIAGTYYSIDGGPQQTYGEPFTAALATGVHTITFWSVDIAGNVEARETISQTVSVKVDTDAPTIEGSQLPPANAAGWNNAAVDVTFTCQDVGSGIQTGVAGCAGDTLLVNETPTTGQMVTGDALDLAGNVGTTVYGPVRIDTTRPTLSGAATTAPNAAGWYKGDVDIVWTGDDALSGIDATTQPAISTVTGEGVDLGAGPVTIADVAGNISDPASVHGIRIDRTRPTVSGSAVNDDGTTRTANAAGWFNSAVRVRFTATDSLSGIQDQPSDVVLNLDGADLSAKGRTTDLADNASSVTVSGINIDSKAPHTTASSSCDGSNDWCRGQTATVVLEAVDQPGLSGVREIRYTINGGQEEVVAGASTEVLVPLAAASGTATVVYHSVDNAGNVEAGTGVSLQYDNIAPTVTSTLSPKANAHGWSKATTVVHFDATDDDGGSGLDVATVTPDVTVSDETDGSGQAVHGSAKDLAGNTGTSSVTVRLDKTAPTVTAAVESGDTGANGWYTGPVTVGFTCDDALSGIATCAADVVLNGEGRSQAASGAAADNAGNRASAAVEGIAIDTTKPVITVSGARSSYSLGEAHGITCSATDATSGVDSDGCTVTVTGGTANGVGAFTYTATAADLAGNVQTTSGRFTVVYVWGGFLQPINDTAHQVGASTSIFKAASTVPVKFQLKNVDGTIVQALTAPEWLTPAKGSATTAAPDETVYADPATSGSTYRWDGQQYIYNWGTSKGQAGYYWRVGVKLDDGQIHYVNLGLR